MGRAWPRPPGGRLGRASLTHVRQRDVAYERSRRSTRFDKSDRAILPAQDGTGQVAPEALASQRKKRLISIRVLVMFHTRRPVPCHRVLKGLDSCRGSSPGDVYLDLCGLEGADVWDLSGWYLWALMARARVWLLVRERLRLVARLNPSKKLTQIAAEQNPAGGRAAENWLTFLQAATEAAGLRAISAIDEFLWGARPRTCRPSRPSLRSLLIDGKEVS